MSHESSQQGPVDGGEGGDQQGPIDGGEGGPISKAQSMEVRVAISKAQSMEVRVAISKAQSDGGEGGGQQGPIDGGEGGKGSSFCGRDPRHWCVVFFAKNPKQFDLRGQLSDSRSGHTAIFVQGVVYISYRTVAVYISIVR